MRYFFSSGEPSGEVSAIALADAIRAYDPQAQFEGIGGAAMRAAGFALWRDHRGWASLGPLAAIPRIPKLLAAMLLTARHLRATKPDLVVLVDFGVFNLRLASTLRRFGYAGAILDVFPPGTWLDSEEKARRVSALTVPLTAFEHQAAFYRTLGCPIAYFGHPLASRYRLRARRPPPPADGGCVALLPGSRAGELRRHVPVLIDAYRVLQRRRPRLRGVIGAADERCAAMLARALAGARAGDLEIVRGVTAAIQNADAAWVASGTAVLETAISGVPVVALYVIPRILMRYGRRMIAHRFVTLPNLVLEREVVPELLQDGATPERLADSLDRLMRDSSEQYTAFEELRVALGPPDALDRCARFAVALASGTVDEP